MKKMVRNFLRNFILNLLQESISKSNNPYDIKFISDNSFIYMPSKIDGGENLKIGTSSSIGQYSWVGAFISYSTQHFNPQIIIGDNVYIGNFACITAIQSIMIDDNTLISEHFFITDHYHGIDPLCVVPFRNQLLESKGNVTIGKNCFIGYRVTILSGVILGDYCIVAAHSLVNKSFPPYTMVGGVPAKAIKKYCFESKKWIKI